MQRWAYNTAGCAPWMCIVYSNLSESGGIGLRILLVVLLMFQARNLYLQ